MAGADNEGSQRGDTAREDRFSGATGRSKTWTEQQRDAAATKEHWHLAELQDVERAARRLRVEWRRGWVGRLAACGHLALRSDDQRGVRLGCIEALVRIGPCCKRRGAGTLELLHGRVKTR